MLCLTLATLTLGCEEKGSGQAYLDSISGGGSGPGTAPTPTPDDNSGTPRTVTISWTASRARDVGQTGGGVHTTSTTATLTSGRHYVIITAFTASGASAISQTATVVVP